MRAFITGAHGFVGRHLADHLRLLGDDVVAVDRDCDVTDRERVVAKLRESSPDAIYHLAALTHIGDSWKEPTEFTRVNVLGTVNVLDAARAVAPTATVIIVSSADVYGVVHESDLPLVETKAPAPANPYSQSKMEVEYFAREAARSAKQRVIIARPFNHVGPGQSAGFIVPALVERLLEARARQRNEIAVGDLSPRRDFTDVRDVVRAYRLMVQYAKSGEIYNVASGRDLAMSDLASQLVQMIAPGVRLQADPSLFRPVEVPVMRGSFAKLHDTTGWEPLREIDDSLRDVIEECRSRRADSA